MANPASEQSSQTDDQPRAINPFLAIGLLIFALLCGAIASEIISPWLQHGDPAEMAATNEES